MQVNQENQFKLLEQKVDNKLQQLEVQVERRLTDFAYKIDSRMHQLDTYLTGQLTTIRKDHFYSDKRFIQLVENVKRVVNLIGQHIGQLTEKFSFQNNHLEMAAKYFQETKENYGHIVLYYRQMIRPLDQLVADMAYVVRTLQSHYLKPIPEDQAKSWDPPIEATSSYAPVVASQHDAQLTHLIEILQTHNREIRARLESFHDYA